MQVSRNHMMSRFLLPHNGKGGGSWPKTEVGPNQHLDRKPTRGDRGTDKTLCSYKRGSDHSTGRWNNCLSLQIRGATVLQIRGAFVELGYSRLKVSVAVLEILQRLLPTTG